MATFFRKALCNFHWLLMTFFYFSNLLRCYCRYWSLNCVFRVLYRSVKIPWRSRILSVSQKIQNGKKKKTSWQLWVLEINLFLVINKICEQSFMTLGQMGHEICLFKVCIFLLSAIAPPFGQSKSNSCHGLLVWPSINVPSITTFDCMVMWVPSTKVAE